MDVRLRIGDRTRGARVARQGDRLAIRLDGGAAVDVAARRLADGTWHLAIQGEDGAARVLRAAGFADRSTRQLWLDGRTLAYERVLDTAARRADAGAGLSAAIPAVVLELRVAAGDAVAEGDTLLLLESMKMVMPIVAPHGGVVTAVNCRAGEHVAPGTPLVVLSAAETPPAP